MQWAIFTESHNGLIWKEAKSHLIPTSLSWAGKHFPRPGCPKPHPALPGMGHLWDVRAPSLFCLRMSQSKVFPAKETSKIICQKCEKMANVLLFPQLFLLCTDKIPRAASSPSIPCLALHPCATTDATIPVSPLGTGSCACATHQCLLADGGAQFWGHHWVVSRLPC